MAAPTIEVCLTPELFHLHDPKGKIVVVVDILRATSTICTALANGASAIIPVEHRDETLEIVASRPDVLKAAEREGERVPGFELGNSPYEYTSDKVSGKTIVLTTTNGTRVIKMAQDAEEIVIGSFLNLKAVADYLIQEQKPVLIFCAGWKGQFNLEDTLFAGALAKEVGDNFQQDGDAVLASITLYQKMQHNLQHSLKQASHYQRLSRIGIGADLEYCVQQNIFNTVPTIVGDSIVV